MTAKTLRQYMVDKDTPLSMGMVIVLVTVVVATFRAYFGLIETQIRIETRLDSIEARSNPVGLWTRDNMQGWVYEASKVLGTTLPSPRDYVDSSR
jgi:hypothetical protein